MANEEGTSGAQRTYFARIVGPVGDDAHLACAWLPNDLTPYDIRIPGAAFPEEPAPNSWWRCVVTGEVGNLVVTATEASSTPEWQAGEREFQELCARIEEELRQEEEEEKEAPGG